MKRLAARTGSWTLIGAAVRRLGVDWLIRGEAREGRGGAAVRKALEDSDAAWR